MAHLTDRERAATDAAKVDARAEVRKRRRFADYLNRQATHHPNVEIREAARAALAKLAA